MFNSFEEIKELYDKKTHDIFYEHGNEKYQVNHIGSTIYCRHMEKNMGMGAITNFPLEYFYAVERPLPEPEPIAENTETEKL